MRTTNYTALAIAGIYYTAVLTDRAVLNPCTVRRRFPFFLKISKYATHELNYAENTFPM